MHERSVLERAFEIARSGTCQGLSALRRQLRAEGYDHIESHLSGLGLRRQLTDLIEAAGGLPRESKRGERGRFRHHDPHVADRAGHGAA